MEYTPYMLTWLYRPRKSMHRLKIVNVYWFIENECDSTEQEKTQVKVRTM